MKRTIDPTTVTARLVQRCTPGTPRSVVVGGASYLPAGQGVNGEAGWQTGHYERALNVEGPWTLDFPNGQGPDGRLHRYRFLQRTDPAFQPGDEFVEIYRDAQTLLYVGALLNVPNHTLSLIQVGGYDALWLLKKVRETDAGWWCHAPRDVFEHYTRAWNLDVATGFPEPGAAALTGAAGPVTAGSFTARYAATNTGLPVCRLSSAGIGSLVMATPPPAIGYQATDPYEPWRVEASFYVSGPLDASGSVSLTSPDGNLGLQLNPGASPSGLTAIFRYGGSALNFAAAPVPGGALIPGQIDMALEGRERWIWCYVQGQLIGLLPMPPTYQPIDGFYYNPGVGATVVDVLEFTYDRAPSWLMRGADKGDRVLPGLPAAGGLQADYFDDTDLVNVTNGGDQVLNPTRQPYAARLELTLNHPAAGAPWQPPGPAQVFSARFTGAIYLDLARFDYRLRVTAGNSARLWVGKTRMGEQAIDGWPPPGGGARPSGAAPWTSGLLRALLGNTSGWYPLKLELSDNPGAAMLLAFERSDAPGTFTAVPSTMLSPEGIYSNTIRHDSHYDTLAALSAAFGFQFRCEPRSLESGEFPGQIIPRVRCGRDYNVKVTSDDSTGLALISSGEDMAARIVADAQGIADPAGAAQLSASLIDHARARGHMFTATEVESLSDITDPNLLRQRLASRLALRSRVWDDIASRPPGHPELAEQWPPNPTLAVLPSKFAWEPGDGLLRAFEELATIDDQPTQLSAVIWDFHPHGVIAPQARFRTYPRGLYWTLRAFRQEDTAHNRNYQQQLAERNGTTGGVTGTIAASPAAAALDGYSRMSTSSVTRVWLDVTRKIDPTVQWTIEVNGANTGVKVNAPARYDISGW
nr:hypothetical protein [Actinomycetota bacterium]